MGPKLKLKNGLQYSIAIANGRNALLVSDNTATVYCTIGSVSTADLEGTR